MKLDISWEERNMILYAIMNMGNPDFESDFSEVARYNALATKIKQAPIEEKK